MAEIAVGLLGPVIELGKCIAEPIKRQFNYLCCFNSNIHDLREEAKRLNDRSKGLDMRVNIARNNAEVIVPEVETWFGKVKAIQDKKNEIESEAGKIQNGCLAIKSRYSLSRTAKKTTEAMNQLREDCPNYDVISLRGPPAAAALIPLGPTREFESRKQIEEDIMAALKDNKVNIMGIYGMGGVGKTTMAKKIMNRVREEHVFEEAVLAVVSQQVDKLRIQDELAGQLKLYLEGQCLSSRAHELRTRLKGGKRIFIVLDDVWEVLKIEELIGIHPESGLEGCAILLTSRHRDVLRQMGAEPVCEIRTLSKTEAWSLFKEKAGNCVDDPNVVSVAQQVVEECNCLPIALVTVGATLKDKKNTSIWKGVLQKLKRSNPTDLPQVLANVYNPLKSSYDCLNESPHARPIHILVVLPIS